VAGEVFYASGCLAATYWKGKVRRTNIMGFLDTILHALFGTKKQRKQKTTLGKTLIVRVGETSADDQDGDLVGQYQVKEGKVKTRVLSKTRRQSKDGLDFDRWDTIEIRPVTRTAVVTYQLKSPHWTQKSKRVRLFKYWKRDTGVIRL